MPRIIWPFPAPPDLLQHFHFQLGVLVTALARFDWRLMARSQASRSGEASSVLITDVVGRETLFATWTMFSSSKQRTT